MMVDFNVKIKFISISTILLAILCVDFPSLARRSLPDSASEINEYYDSHLISSDFMRCLTAKININEFYRYVENLGMVSFVNNFAGLDPPSYFWSYCPLDSWIHNRKRYNDTDLIFIDPHSGGDYYAMARYSSGYVYFSAMAW